jgi:hypothetical protein
VRALGFSLTPLKGDGLSTFMSAILARPRKDHGKTTRCFAANVHRRRVGGREMEERKRSFYSEVPHPVVLLFRTSSAAAAAVRAESFNSELKGTSTMRAD